MHGHVCSTACRNHPAASRCWCACLCIVCHSVLGLRCAQSPSSSTHSMQELMPFCMNKPSDLRCTDPSSGTHHQQDHASQKDAHSNREQHVRQVWHCCTACNGKHSMLVSNTSSANASAQLRNLQAEVSLRSIAADSIGCWHSCVTRPRPLTLLPVSTAQLCHTRAPMTLTCPCSYTRICLHVTYSAQQT